MPMGSTAGPYETSCWKPNSTTLPVLFAVMFIWDYCTVQIVLSCRCPASECGTILTNPTTVLALR
jgi:hypothetical protein